MKRAELERARDAGDLVWVVLPYSGGRGYAEIVELDVPRLEKPEWLRSRSTWNVRVRFYPGQSAAGERIVPPAAIVRRGVRPL